MGWRKPLQRKQGLKILAYGADTTGKSVFALTFPKCGIVDTESKLGVYENNPKYNKNIVGIADTVDYYEVIGLAEDIVKKPDNCDTFVTDSETNLYDDMQVSVMEVEEEKAKKFKKNIDDATIQQRGWGKIKLNNARFRNLKAQMSAQGTTIISIAHMKEVFDDETKKKIGEKPDLKAGSGHDYDVILRFYKTGSKPNFKFFAEVEKDTTETFKLGTVIENPSYKNWGSYIEANKKNASVSTSYDKAIEQNMENMRKDDEEIAQEEVAAVKTEIIRICSDNGGSSNSVVMDILKKHEPSVGNPNKIKDIDKLKILLAELKKEFEPTDEENE